MKTDSKINLLLILTALIVILISVTTVAFGELFYDVTIDGNTLTIIGFSDENYVGIAIKDSQGMLVQTARAQLDSFGDFFIELDIPYEAGFYEVMIGSSEFHETVEIFIGTEIELEEIKVEDVPYGGQVAPASIETPELEVLLVNGIPDWIREVFVMWANGYISDLELIVSIEYLIKTGVIEL